MRWPWAKRGEQRAYSDTVVNALLAAAAGGGTADAAATGAVQSSCGFWSRAMAAATVSPATGTAAIVTPDVLYDIGRDLILHGQYLAQFVVDEQGPRLVRPADHDVAGGAGPGKLDVQAHVQRAIPSNDRKGLPIGRHPHHDQRGGVIPMARRVAGGGCCIYGGHLGGHREATSG